MMKNPTNIIILGLLLLALVYFLSTVFKSSSSQNQNSMPSATPSTTPKTSNLKVKIAKNCNYEYNTAVGVGEYNAQKLNELDGFYKEISSIEIPNGLKVILYEGDNFNGPQQEFTSNVSCLSGHSSQFNDRAGSMKVIAL